MKKRVGLLVAVVVVVVTGIFLGQRAAWGEPPVSWQPEPFDVAVPPGGRLPTKVMAVLTKDIPASRVEVTPSLAPYVVSIEPVTFPPLQAGSEVTINLVFEVASGTPVGKYEGTLHLRQDGERGRGTQARPLSVVLKVGDLLYPPDPGEAGKETLEGIDSDGDGIRDDIQRYIETRYPEEPAVRAGLRQLALPLQAALRDAGSKEQSLANREEFHRAGDCVKALLDLEPGIKAQKELLAEALNTEERSRAYIQYDSQFDGMVFTVGEINVSRCDFDSIVSGGVQ